MGTIDRHDRHHTIVLEDRRPSVIAHDPYAHAYARTYHPRHHWAHFHPRGHWFATWGINSWEPVSNVTCEAANEYTGELYPVTASRRAGEWDDASINAMLDQALDECARDAGAGRCVPVSQQACTYD